MTRLPVTFALICGVLAATTGGAAAITIDGNLDDWAGAVVFESTEQMRAAAASPYGDVERLHVAHDQEFLYFRVDFARPRPFADETQAQWQQGFWTNRRYIVLDTDGDGEADYYTCQQAVRGKGHNATYLSRREGDEWKTYLWYEGHAQWQGIQGHYTTDGRSIEIRVPRTPLGLDGGMVGIQVQMSYRDGIEGDNKWANDRYPSATEWYLYDLDKGAKIEGAAGAEAGNVTMVRSATAPTVDGVLDDPAWTDKPVLSGFSLNRGSLAPEAGTEAIVTYDDDCLYFGVTAHEPNMAGLVTKASEAESSRVWGDDAIELFVDYHHDGRSYVHLGVTPAGVTAGQLGITSGGQLNSIDLSLPFRATAVRGDEAWTVEIAVPFATLGTRPVAGEVWGLNVCRGRPQGREYSSWAGIQGAFAQPARFGTIVFSSDNGLVINSRGLCSRKGNADGSNALSGSYRGEAGQRLLVQIEASTEAGATAQVRREFATSDAGEASFAVPYTVAGEEGEKVAFGISVGERVLYENSVPVIRDEFPLVWETKDPLYQELWGEEGPGMGARGVIMWAHDVVNYRFGPFCLKHAQPYVLSEVYANAGRRNLRYIATADWLDRDLFGFRKYSAQHGLKLICQGNTRAKAEGKPADEGNVAYVIDYENQEVFLQQLKDSLTRWRPYFWAVMTADELQEHDLIRGLKLHYQNGPYPFMEQVDREVKAEFGYGKWGIPESLEDKNPFRWIAYRRWYNDRFMAMQKRIYETVKSVDPELLVIGPDPLAQVMPLDYSGYSRYCDIVTHQLYPRRNPNEQDFAWVTKTLRDLSGKPTMPCAHVEHYANSFRPAQVLELMSQVYRAGGEGFHLYMPDTAGTQSKTMDLQSDRYGSPPRWETVMGTLDRAARDPRPRPPRARAAVLLSNDGMMGEYLGAMQGGGQYRWLFTLLAPCARGWFQVIEDNQIARGELDLSAYQAIYVPGAVTQRREVVQDLLAYVEQGGMLVVTQPDCFTYHLDGETMEDLRARLFVPVGESGPHTGVTGTGAEPVGGFTGELPVFSGKGAELTPTDDATELLRYENGATAAVRKSVGDGSVVLFGFDPTVEKAAASEAWRAYFKALHSGLGQEVDLDIWRFTFPPVPAADIKPPSGLCLSNNFVMWDTNEPIPVANLAVEGTYSYDVAPDYSPDEGGVTDIPFARGDLMDRRKAPEVKDGTYDEEFKRFAVAWKSTAPVTISFDLKQPYALDRVWLLYRGQLPELVVEGLVGDRWQPLGTAPKQEPEDSGDFPAVSIELQDAPAVQHCRLRLGARDEGKALIVPELEIWARQ